MDRRMAVLLILILNFMHTNMGWLFGVSDLDTDRRAESRMPCAAKPERVRKSISLRDKHDNSKMLEYLRGGKTVPPSIFKLYDYEQPDDQDDSTPESNLDEDQNTDNNSQNNQNLEAVYELDESEQQPEVVEATTPIIRLQPDEEEKNTCLWLPDPQETDQDTRVAMKKAQPNGLVAGRFSRAWKCISKRYWLSFDKIKRKVCDMFEGLLATEQPMTSTTATTTLAPEILETTPKESRPAPVESTTAPVDSTPVPEESTPAPEESTPAPEDSTPAPDESTPAPEESTPAPEETTSAPKYTTTTPKKTTTKRKKEKTKPKYTITTPKETKKTTTTPKYTTTTPKKTTTKPKYTTTTPKKTTTTQTTTTPVTTTTPFVLNLIQQKIAVFGLYKGGNKCSTLVKALRQDLRTMTLSRNTIVPSIGDICNNGHSIALMNEFFSLQRSLESSDFAIISIGLYPYLPNVNDFVTYFRRQAKKTVIIPYLIFTSTFGGPDSKVRQLNKGLIALCSELPKCSYVDCGDFNYGYKSVPRRTIVNIIRNETMRLVEPTLRKHL